MASFSNVLYDPSRDGYDTSSWRTIFGSPNVQGGVLVLQEAATLHRSDCLRGDLTLNVNVPNSPVGGESRRFGFYSPNIGAYAWFAIEGETLYAQISDGGSNSSQETLSWSDGVVETWEGSGIDFRIVWEAGLVTFYINGTRKTVLSGASVPRVPMAVYMLNGNTDYMTIPYVTIQSIQSLFVHTDEGDTSSGTGPLLFSQVISIAESTTRSVQLGDQTPAEAISITESTTGSVQLGNQAPAEAVSIAEDVATAVT